jgi:hypothetical protein
MTRPIIFLTIPKHPLPPQNIFPKKVETLRVSAKVIFIDFLNYQII